MLYLLDTDIASYIIKSKSPSAQRQLATIPPACIAVSAITSAELHFGLKRLPPDHRLHTDVRRFLSIVSVQPWPPEAAAFYAEIRFHLQITGQPIGEMDTMIAAHALALGATLVTNNEKHYQRIALPLTIENWTI